MTIYTAPILEATDLDGGPVVTDDGSLTLRHPVHGECYHSSLGARAEARWLYIESSGILERYAEGGGARGVTTVLDVGLGLGYNAIATLAAWQDAANPGNLEIVSLEVDAELVRAFASGQGPWQQNWVAVDRSFAQSLREVEPPLWQGHVGHPLNASCSAQWTVVVGDAVRLNLQGHRPTGGGFDFVWQDAFSPGKNPQMWTADWFGKVREASKEGTVLMSYSVARGVRDALSQAGWVADRIKTPVRRKRHWLSARAV